MLLVSYTLTNPKAFKNRFQAVAAVVPAVTTAAAATAAAAVT
jgi:hypothetical protein